MLIPSSTVLNTYSRTTAIPNYLPREQIDATRSRLQQTNIILTSLDKTIDTAKERKALVVVARSHDVLEWMEDVSPDWTKYPYIVTEDTNSNSTLFVPENKGNEAMRYLSFIIDNYDSLPDIIVFRHGHKNSWHQRFDAASEVNHLNLTTVHLRGYQNFACQAPCAGEQHIYLADRQRAEIASNNETNKLLLTRSDPLVDDAIYEMWDSWFGVSMPEDLAAACCAQFAVAKKAVYRRTREEYSTYRQWLLSTNLESHDSGMVFERLWHVIFGMPPKQCEADEQCYCNTYTSPLVHACPP